MRNAIKYFYNIDVAKLIEKDNCFFFNNYMLKEINRMIDYQFYHFLIGSNIHLYHIVFNAKNEMITIINNKRYILLNMDYIPNVNMELIKKFSINVRMGEIKKWNVLWEQKVDYFEQNIIHIKNKELLVIFPYYIGLSELAIRINKEVSSNVSLSVCHNRLDKEYEFFCPDNIIIDYKVRDIAEYIKNKFFNDSLNLMEVLGVVNQMNLTDNDYKLLFSRLLFPTYFFDCIEFNKDITKYTSKANQYEIILFNIYNSFRYKTNMPTIEWIIKKT